jgi:hypothetical protein
LSEDVRDYEALIPNLTRYAYEKKSLYNPHYNCIAWAAGEDNRLWWPPAHIGAIEYWPPGVRAWETLEAFVDAFESIGYRRCESRECEDGVEKIAIYVSDRTGKPTHAARQLMSGTWTSKLGAGIDIEHHDLEAVEGEAGLSYGRVAAVMARAR